MNHFGNVQPAIENLTNNQIQADMDGCMVTVSRQALDEVLTAIESLTASPGEQKPPPAAGWDITDDMVERACKAYADATGYYVKFHRGLSSPSADGMRKGMRAALSALRREAPAPEGVADSDLDAKIAALAHRFWSIHPSSVDDMGLTREQFYVHEITKLIKAVRG